MRTLLLVLMLLVLLGNTQAQQPQTQDDLSKALTAAMQQKGVIGKNQVIVIDHTVDRALGTGVSGEAVGDKAAINGEGSAPTVSLPGATATGGDAKFKGTAEMVTKSAAFRWIAAFIGFIVMLAGWLIGQQGNIRGGLIVGGSGLAVLVGAILFPDWLAVGLLLFFFVNSLEYAYRHGLLTGSLASVVTSVNSAGASALSAFHEAAKSVVEPREASIINKAAVKNEAYEVKV